MLKWLQLKWKSWRSRLVKYQTTREIVKVLSVAHAQELSNTPGELWGTVRDRQAHEIRAVRAGNVTIVDRRSWQWPYMPSQISRIRQPIVKMVPYNIRRFAKSPIPRRAINLIKNSIISLEWDIVPKTGSYETVDDETRFRIDAARYVFKHPNNQDSGQSFMEVGIDDMLTFGAFVVEPQLTPDPKRPLKMWVVDSSTIRIFPTWRESDPDEPHYAQMTGLKGERGIIVFYDDELMYLRDNPTVETPFGLGKMEVAFQSVNSFLGVQEMSGRAGADQVHRTFFWWEGAESPNNVEMMRRHLTNDIEGQAKISMQTGMKKPDIVDVTSVVEADLLLNWQELLLRIIAAGFDLSAMALNVTNDVNRSTGEVLDDKDFRSAVVPIATKVADGFTVFMLHKKLGWKDLEFRYLNLDDPDAQTKMSIQSSLFTSHAATPNGIRKSMGLEPLNTPWADLTMIEMIVANAQLSAQLQDQNAQNATNRQQESALQMQQMYQQQPQDEQEPDEQQGVGSKTSKGISLKPIPAPKIISIAPPKLAPIAVIKPPLLGAGTSSSSEEESDSSNAAPKNMLIEMTETLRDYLETLTEDQEKDDSKLDDDPSKEDYKKQAKKFRKGRHKQSLIEKVVYNVDDRGVPKTRSDQAMFQRNNSGQGKEIPATVPSAGVPIPDRTLDKDSLKRPKKSKGTK